VYDSQQEAHEFFGSTRAEAVAKATAFFGVGEADLAIAEIEPSRVAGVGSRVVLVAYRREAGPPGRTSSDAGRPSEGRRGREGWGRDREPREGGRRDRDRDRGGRGRRDEGHSTRERRPSEGESRAGEREPRSGGREGRLAEDPGPSTGTSSTPLGEIGQFVKGLVEKMDLGPFEIGEGGEGEGLIILQLRGHAAARLADGDGRAVDAVQLLANQASLRAGGDDAKRVVVEVEGNADQRATLLTKIAERAAQRARETGRPVALEAMSPKERRTVHLALREAAGIATMSVGEGRYRQVVVVPDSAPEYEEAKRYEAQSLRDSRE
jgi:spoIIIJ-associated protein